MKKLLLILLCLPMIGFGQNVYIPDANFKVYLVWNPLININGDTEIQVSEATAFNGEIDCQNYSISDLTGIEAFTALTSLNCEGNQLTSLDVSQHTALTDLNCSWNNLTSLDVSTNTALTYLVCEDNPLTSLDVSNNTTLTHLQCINNQLTSLDVSNNTALEGLWCGDNQLTSLDLRSLTLIVLTLYTNGNQNLFCIDVDNPALAQAVFFGNIDSWTSFDTNCVTALGCADTLAFNYDSTATVNDGSCYYGKTYVPDDNFENYLEANGMGDSIMLNDSVLTGNINTVTIVNVLNQNISNLTGIEGFTALTNLRFDNNQLTSLDVTNNTALIELSCDNNQLTSLDVSNNTALMLFGCNFNQLTSLDVSQNTALEGLWCGDNQLTSLDVRNGNNTNMLGCYTENNPNLFCIDVDNVVWSTANWISIDSWTFFDTNCVTALGCIDPLALNYDSLATIDDGSCTYQMTYVPDSIFEAYLESNGMGNGIANDDYVTTANISMVTNLDVYSGAFWIFDLTGIEDFTALTYLNCGGNQLTSLDVSQNTALTGLECDNNQLTSLDVSANTALTELRCWDNQLTSLDVSGATALTYLSCGNGNQLTSLDVSQNTALTVLGCSDNQLTSLDVSNNTALTGLQCIGNQITSLNVSQNTALTSLRCDENLLTSLNVSQNTALTYLNCSDNQLTSLDISQNTALTGLECDNNQLTSLDVSQNTALYSLECNDNQLTSLDVSNNTTLQWLICNNNQLTSLDIRNGNNVDMGSDDQCWAPGIWCALNPYLTCISVDDSTYSTANWTVANGHIDAYHFFSTSDCLLGCTDVLACNYDSSAAFDDGSCSYLPITLNNDSVLCFNFSDATLSVNYNIGLYAFAWSNGETTQSIDSLPIGSYSVIVTDTSGCSATLTANVILATPPADSMYPEICYVTVDSLGFNKIVVKQMSNPLTSRYIIYKETSANLYTSIDTMNTNNLEYLDVSSNPMAQSYRYKISVLDTCGNESVKSDFHKTIHLTMSLGVNGEVNLLWNTYEGYQPSDYLIFRSVNNGAMNQVSILPGTNLTYTDLTPPSGILNYQVRAIAPNCNIIPFAKNSTSMLVSNVINHNTTSVEEHTTNKELLKVTDLLGKETKQTNQPLFYIYDDGTVEKRIVIE